MKPFINPADLHTNNFTYNGQSVYAFRTKAENETAYFSPKGCEELIKTYEETVKPFYDEKINNLTITIKTYEDWLTIIEDFNPSLEKAFKKLKADFDKIMNLVDANFLPFITASSLGFTYHLPQNFQTPSKANESIKMWIDGAKTALIEMKNFAAFHQNFYNKAQSKLAEMQSK